jgi:uncharacterized protein YbjT (DUF2867 family)
MVGRNLGEGVMKILVIGGTGLIGSQLVAVLRQRGQDVLAASPRLMKIVAIGGTGLRAPDPHKELAP